MRSQRVTLWALLMSTFIVAVMLTVTLATADEMKGRALFGTLASFDRDASQIVVNTKLPGILGPEKRDVPIRLTSSTIVTLCWAEACESRTADEGLAALDSLSLFDVKGMSPVGKEVTVVYHPERRGEVSHVRVNYMDLPIHSGTFSGTYDFRMEEEERLEREVR